MYILAHFIHKDLIKRKQITVLQKIIVAYLTFNQDFLISIDKEQVVKTVQAQPSFVIGRSE